MHRTEAPFEPEDHTARLQPLGDTAEAALEGHSARTAFKLGVHMDQLADPGEQLHREFVEVDRRRVEIPHVVSGHADLLGHSTVRSNVTAA